MHNRPISLFYTYNYRCIHVFNLFNVTYVFVILPYILQGIALVFNHRIIKVNTVKYTINNLLIIFCISKLIIKLQSNPVFKKLKAQYVLVV